ncbi:hypothetical protein AC579_10440 [Pseudocercospora musae]|uniref:Uncharacterized protein n=1 Tax=Pseudocercospora musae TaxID=113226 RepID=A0A139IKN1_9PEZI|nr:hypothetical protein AC579_10440 [Pseudocercospora musae]
MFSIYNEDLLYESHHRAVDVANSSSGAYKADANSIYRVGSISKFLTVYIFLVKEGFSTWEDLVAEYVPELAGASQNLIWADGILGDWNQVTIGHVAGQELLETASTENAMSIKPYMT